MSDAVDPAARVPTFRRGVKFRFDTVRDAWMVLAPERLFLPDAPGVEVLKLVDGVRNVGAIVDDLCTRFNAPREVVLADVATMAQELADKGVLSW